MPIKIPRTLHAYEDLSREQVFVMTEDRAEQQDIRPLKVAIVNLMPTTVDTEIQLLRVLGHSPLQVDIMFLRMGSHESKNAPPGHLDKFYISAEDIISADKRFDGFIITGAPVETLPFEEVDYWDELVRLIDYSKKNVFSTMHICWGAQAGLYRRYGIQKKMLEPLILSAQMGNCIVYCVDAAHFVMGGVMGSVWSKKRVFIQTPSGRSRLNVLGAINPLNQKLLTVVNEDYINAVSVCENTRGSFGW